ncbi:hypothetical protein [Nocardia brasiliensis]|uniref:DUF8175 domain-containing protein n=1 Tax=Nocardia brasiliensis (strain ATCC 700358 / HUJEG-1) TaxID=1133849 RepID=K0ESV2_NOCB7|nr:hypothetical protein [Nocardia brasiliensis]AFU02863.1 hypothetical protein O3I_024550 [Nocardia brasiliensis ATCC 700358]
MRSLRVLTVLFASIIALVIAAFAWTINRDDHASDTPAGEPSDTTLPQQSFPHLSPGVSRPPTTDLFGSRLEVPSQECGVALGQDPAARPDPARGDYLITEPAGMQWQRGWGGAALPVSSSDGPTRIDPERGIATGFSRTPQGAVLAALDAVGRALAAPEGTWQQVVGERFYDGGPALISRFARSRTTPDAARYVVVPEGVRVQPGYRDDLAVVQIASRTHDGYAVGSWAMTWINGDWRVRVPADIETLWGPATPVLTVAGFGSWKGLP